MSNKIYIYALFDQLDGAYRFFKSYDGAKKALLEEKDNLDLEGFVFIKTYNGENAFLKRAKTGSSEIKVWIDLVDLED